ncbi:ATP-dependent 6-phosphofructokinase [Ordospora colligata]|uniref:ATP-dependent 6-phosphofructokinase n=1 Tax=Ordospora colligata OC4 TaxID=1354746 RepID=A0A0B2UL73_9MICR|nr:ATP-dependent 6-phosphofructokinase [Ordospora colligata OC4]KHN70118.1 ATP-dependent 6-phosphofructokinase [Ordospora colligata OC4]TBU16685.1 ATP-dependent 6-phosphofructokinase [Ordospora colligata]TBU19258.1 ATP-dependent 6-phosphofructokinase [Ordospora colligata]
MQAVVEELLLSGDSITQKHGEIYELLGLDVVYDKGRLKIYSTNKAKIISIGAGIHIRACYKSMSRLATRGFVNLDGHSMPLEILDMMGNKIVVTFIGKENANRIAIVTSGGDAPGMNSAIKSIIRTGIKWGATVYGVYNGYDGLINDNIKKLNWDTETYYSSQGGTVLLSARSDRFLNAKGRKQAVLNMAKKRINCMIILGGDGSLKGALELKNEFREHLRELLREGKISSEEKRKIRMNKSRVEGKVDVEQTTDGSGVMYSDFYGKPECYKANPTVYHDLNSSDEVDDEKMEKDEDDRCDEEEIERYVYGLKVVGIPASIDNDIYGTEVSLGEDSAIHRVVEAIDHLMSTMKSHSRAFVIEVMGRKCGWIALMSALGCAADYVLLPEVPGDWKKEMMDAIAVGKKHGKPEIFVIVSEGAVEADGTPIRVSSVVEEIDKVGIEVRSLKLGHIQRGGPPSFQDRVYGTLFGIKAVETVMEPVDEPLMVRVFNDEVDTIDLREVVHRNEMTGVFEKEMKFPDVFKSRNEFFRLAYVYFRKALMTRVLYENGCNTKIGSVGILQVGGRSSGMNAVLNAIVQYSLTIGIEPYYIPNGFEGLIKGQVVKAKLYEFSSDVNNGGSAIGVGNNSDIDIEELQRKINESGLESLIVIGGSKALSVIDKIKRINVIIVPATAHNNMPGTGVSIGSDTALNTILKMSDMSKLNSFSCKNSVFVIEIGGEECGYLSLMGGIAAGAFEVFIPERRYLIGNLSEAAQRLRMRFKESSRRGIVIFRNERTFCSIPTDSFCKVLKTDSKGLFETGYSILGSIQQGSNPSPTDRIYAAILGIEAVDLCVANRGVGVVGICGNSIKFTKIEDVLEAFDFEHDREKDPKWLKYSNICRSVE